VAKQISAVPQWLVHGMWTGMHEAGLAEYEVSEIKIVAEKQWKIYRTKWWYVTGLANLTEHWSDTW
jgi:hypothetical protein